MTEETTAPEGAEQAPEGADAGVQLSFADIGAIVSIIDICSKRGAFEGTELEQVGMLRRRVSEFLDSVAPKQSEDEAEAGSEEPTVDEEASAA